MTARRKRNASASVIAGLPVIRRQDEVLETVYEADPDGRPVVHHCTVRGRTGPINGNEKVTLTA